MEKPQQKATQNEDGTEMTGESQLTPQQRFFTTQCISSVKLTQNQMFTENNLEVTLECSSDA